MNSREQDVVQRLLREYTLDRRQQAIRKAHARSDAQRYLAELELLCDDLKEEGINPLSPLGQECVARVLEQRLGKKANQQFGDAEGFPTGEGW